MLTSTDPEYIPGRIAIKLTPAAELVLKKERHPWIFSKSILKINKEGKPGDLAIIFDAKKDTVLGIGLYDPGSAIPVKMLHFGGKVTIGSEFFDKKIATAFEKRAALLQTQTNSYRLIFGENDGFPGLVADVYNEVLVVKIYSAAWFPYLAVLDQLLLTVSGCSVSVLRLSRHLQAQKDLPFTDGMILTGNLGRNPVQFLEHGVHFSADVIRGHKTGYFLDHRHNRKRVGQLARNKTVLDVFAYAGGFSVHALTGGAKEVTSVDISTHALDVARENATLNTYPGKHILLAGDAFRILKDFADQNRTFELVIIDPPSFANNKKDLEVARRKYRQLAILGALVTAKNGILLLASCTSRMTADDFFSINQAALSESGRKFRLLEQTGHDIDHPVSFPEGAYLKCGYYQFSG